ncbi:hypothetical protein ACIG54_33515 [Streptomyces achromogenes]|uniref:hypothetical protein n=1 Tax=Streptomyces achromogenes TaxID=67255 RepID=UPI0037D0580B
MAVLGGFAHYRRPWQRLPMWTWRRHAELDANAWNAIEVAGLPVRDRSCGPREDAKAWVRRAATDEERWGLVNPRDGSVALADCIAMH